MQFKSRHMPYLKFSWRYSKSHPYLGTIPASLVILWMFTVTLDIQWPINQLRSFWTVSLSFALPRSLTPQDAHILALWECVSFVRSMVYFKTGINWMIGSNWTVSFSNLLICIFYSFCYTGLYFLGHGYRCMSNWHLYSTEKGWDCQANS